MNVLVCLARHAPDVVSKQQLRDEVWSDSPFVGDDVITHAIWELRKAFGDSAKDPEYIQTIPRRGYLLLPEITRSSGSGVPEEGARIDHYDLGRELGRGSMGVVYEAVDRRLGRTVAIKFLAPDLTRDAKACQRFVREARLAASLEHPNLATVHEVGETSLGHRYLVMAYYVGGSLKDRLVEGPVAVDEAVHLARQLCAGLAAAHERDIIHRDIKPANLLLDAHGTLKIGDFGVAKLLGGTELTRTGGAVPGTPAYKSPEQSRGESVDKRTDIWSVGVVLFEMLTGRRPFDGDYELAVVQAIVSRRPRIAEDVFGQPVPEGLRRIVARALSKDPDARFQSAADLGEALERFAAGEGTSPVLLPRIPARWWLAAAVAPLVAVVLGFLWWRTGDLPVPDPLVGVLHNATSGPIAPEARDALEKGKKAWLRGNCSEHLGEAHDQFERALDVAPSWGDALGHMAVFLADRYELYGDPGDLAESRRLVEKARLLGIDHPTLRVADARVRRLNDDCAGAESILSLALEGMSPTCDPGDSCDLVYAWLAEAQWCQRKDRQALATFDACLEAGGQERIRCHIKRAQYYVARGPTYKAIEYYEIARTLEPDQTTVLNDLGVLLVENEQYTEAAVYYRQLIDLTEDPEPLLNLGNVYYFQERYGDALDLYREAEIAYRARGQEMPSAVMAIGDALLELGQGEEARRLFREALSRFDSMLIGASRTLKRQGQRAVCLAKLGKTEAARDAIRALRSQDPDNPFLMVYEARILALAGDLEALEESIVMAITAGVERGELKNDAAFIGYRDQSWYNDLIEGVAR